MRQLVGWRDERTVHDPALLSEPRVRRAGRALGGQAANTRARRTHRLAGGPARMVAGGWDAEVLWDTCTTLALRQSFGGGRAAALDALGRRQAPRARGRARSGADVLLLGRPTTTSTSQAEWLEDSLRLSKTILLISHDRRALPRPTRSSRSKDRPRGRCLVRHLARGALTARSYRRGAPALAGRAHLGSRCRSFGAAPHGSDKFASRPGDEVEDRAVRSRRRPISKAGGVDAARRRSRRQASWCASGSRCTGSPTRSAPEIWFGERVAVLGRTGRAESLLRLLAGESVAHDGTWRLASSPGTSRRRTTNPSCGVAVLDVVMKASTDAGGRWPRCGATGCTVAPGSRSRRCRAVSRPGCRSSCSS